MTIIKNEEKGYWEVFFYYEDFTGKRKQKHKRGFKTKKEAGTWAEQFIAQQSHNLDMTFQSFGNYTRRIWHNAFGKILYALRIIS